jgi:CHAT domain-containing protein/tetratricopeptide (TPR) repeat protein
VARGMAARFRRRINLALILVFFASVARAATPEEAAYEDALATFRRGDLKTAQAKIDDALRRFTSSDSDAVWSLRVLRGEVLNGTESCADAIRYLAGLHLPVRLGGSEMAVKRLLALATAQSRCRQTVAATTSLQNAEALSRSKQRQVLGDVLFRKADLEMEAGARDRADRDLRELTSMQNLPPRVEARGWAVLARLRGQQERFDEAIDASRRALEIANSINDQVLARVVRGNLGWLYVETGDYDAAIELLTAAEAENARLGRKSDRITNLLQLGNAYFSQEQYARASDYYQRALALARELNHPSVEFCLANLAQLEIEQRHYAAAQTYNDEALRWRREPDAKLRSALINARIQQKLGHNDKAAELFEQVIHDARSRSLQWEARTFAAMFYAGTGAREAADREYRLAVATAEAARKDLKSDELKLSFPTTLAGLYNGYIEFLVGSGRVEEALAVAETSRARALAEGLGIETSKEKIDPRRVARANRATILSYWLRPGKSYLWVATPSTLKLFSLAGDADISAAIDAYHRDLASPRGTLEASGARGVQLWSMLVAPAASTLAAGSRIIIIPDKRLYDLNFETLVVPTPQPHYWIEEVTLNAASSLRLLARGSEAKPPASLLLIGNPPQSDPSFPPLPLAGAELDRVQAHFRDATLFEGARATPRAYLSSSPERFGFVHFVAHGIATPVRPLDSAVVLARDADGYKLYAREIVRHPLTAHLVTISSCTSAGRRTYAGEGLVGLAWAFLRAGAHHVVAALWEVSDSATPTLMDAMYAAIQSGDDPAAALRKAKLKLLHSTGIYRRPLYWAPFVLYSGA